MCAKQRWQPLHRHDPPSRGVQQATSSGHEEGGSARWLAPRHRRHKDHERSRRTRFALKPAAAMQPPCNRVRDPKGETCGRECCVKSRRTHIAAQPAVAVSAAVQPSVAKTCRRPAPRRRAEPTAAQPSSPNLPSPYLPPPSPPSPRRTCCRPALAAETCRRQALLIRSPSRPHPTPTPTTPMTLSSSPIVYLHLGTRFYRRHTPALIS